MPDQLHSERKRSKTNSPSRLRWTRRLVSICFAIYQLSESGKRAGIYGRCLEDVGRWAQLAQPVRMHGLTEVCRIEGGLESYLIPSEDPGIQLYIRNKHREGMRQFSAERTVIYVNGATQASEATFDLALGGYSWMDYLATHGYDVYFVDLRGYGSSSRPAEMQQPAADNPPLVRTSTAVKDLGTAIDHVLSRRALRRLDIIGWSWGATIAVPIRQATTTR